MYEDATKAGSKSSQRGFRAAVRDAASPTALPVRGVRFPILPLLCTADLRRHALIIMRLHTAFQEVLLGIMWNYVLFNGCAPDAVQCSVQRCKVIYNQNAALHCSNEWLLDDEHVTTPAIKRAMICVQEYK